MNSMNKNKLHDLSKKLTDIAKAARKMHRAMNKMSYASEMFFNQRVIVIDDILIILN